MDGIKPYHIGITGSYGGLNLGDEAILKCIIDQLRNSLPVEITVFSKNPEDTLRNHDVDKAIAVRELSREEILPEIKNLDLLIVGGGGIFFDGEVNIYLREVILANEVAVPVMIYAVSAGPLTNSSNKKLIRDCLNKAAVITVRERDAKKLLEESGITSRIQVTADPALLLPPEPIPDDSLQREGLNAQQRLIGISVREPGLAAPDIDEKHYHSLLANAADYMVDRMNADIVFVPMEREIRDVQQSHAVIAQMLRPQHATVLKGVYSPGQMLSFMNYFMFAVGMRLHFLIFAALQNVPFVALPYASKVIGFLDDLKIVTPPIHLVNAGRLIAHIDNSWDRRELIISKIKEKLPELKKRAKQTNEIAVSLIQSLSPGKIDYTI
ncbi:MAG: polysaccharide pyruvyl transferase [Candidatus Margulisbacteria bacterium GWF2_38_17]|nr:MAG: polysaccharide pyruvyl transferase [Candidatus Margulisbacteria bacterium GWF2_38_17]